MRTLNKWYYKKYIAKALMHYNDQLTAMQFLTMVVGVEFNGLRDNLNLFHWALSHDKL